MKDEKLSFSQEFQLMSPADQKAYVIAISDWDFLRNKVTKIKTPYNIFPDIGFASFGISAKNAALALFTSIGQAIKGYLWLIVIATLIFSGLCFLFQFLQKKDFSESKENVLEEMDHFEDRFRLKAESEKGGEPE